MFVNPTQCVQTCIHEHKFTAEHFPVTYFLFPPPSFSSHHTSLNYFTYISTLFLNYILPFSLSSLSLSPSCFSFSLTLSTLSFPSLLTLNFPLFLFYYVSLLSLFFPLSLITRTSFPAPLLPHTFPPPSLSLPHFSPHLLRPSVDLQIRVRGGADPEGDAPGDGVLREQRLQLRAEQVRREAEVA